MRPNYHYRGALLVGALALSLLAGCRAIQETYAGAVLRGDTISYDAYLTQDVRASPRPTAAQVIDALGTPATVFDRDGLRRRLDYHAFSLTGELKRAEFHFDKDERLIKKQLW